MGFLFAGRFAGKGMSQIGSAIYANTFVACFAGSYGFFVMMCKTSHVKLPSEKIMGLINRIMPVCIKATCFAVVLAGR